MHRTCCMMLSLLVYFLSPLVDRRIIEDKAQQPQDLEQGLFHGNSPGTCWKQLGYKRDGTFTWDLFLNFDSSSKLAWISSLKHIRHLREGKERCLTLLEHFLLSTFPISFPKDRSVLGTLPTSPNSTGVRVQTQSPTAPGSVGFLTLKWPSLFLVVWRPMKNVYFLRGRRLGSSKWLRFS